jgi:hypothetical protein
MPWRSAPFFSTRRSILSSGGAGRGHHRHHGAHHPSDFVRTYLDAFDKERATLGEL